MNAGDTKITLTRTANPAAATTASTTVGFVTFNGVSVLMSAGACRRESFEKLEEKNLRALEPEETSKIIDNPKLKEYLKGHRFYLAGDGIDKDWAHIIKANRFERAQVGPVEKKILICIGRYPLMFEVLEERDIAANMNCRYVLHADGR